MQTRSTFLIGRCAAIVGIAFFVNLALWFVIDRMTGSTEFAALVTGMGSIAIVGGICHGFIGMWDKERESLRPEIRGAHRLLVTASRIGWIVAACSALWLALLQPSGWVFWAFGLVWGVGAGCALALTFASIQRRLTAIE